MTDVALRQTEDGGEMGIDAGVVEMDEGLATACFLSIFGGNEEDDGSDGTKSKQWWGNFDEPDTNRRYRSETQAALNTTPLTTGTLQRFEDAAGRDLAWLVETKVATFVQVIARMPALNTLRLDCGVEVNGTVFPISLNWTKGAQQ